MTRAPCPPHSLLLFDHNSLVIMGTCTCSTDDQQMEQQSFGGANWKWRTETETDDDRLSSCRTCWMCTIRSWMIRPGRITMRRLHTIECKRNLACTIRPSGSWSTDREKFRRAVICFWKVSLPAIRLHWRRGSTMNVMQESERSWMTTKIETSLTTYGELCTISKWTHKS